MNQQSKLIIVGISLLTGILHVVIGPDYHGPAHLFLKGYLIDIILPMNMYLLLQLALRKKLTIKLSRITGALLIFMLGTGIELLQLNNIPVFGATYDPLDMVMYALGVLIGLAIDFYLPCSKQ